MTSDPRPPLLLWFRSDLRLRDHPGVAAAFASGRPVVPLYIHDDAFATRPLGAASRWWLHRSLKALNEDLRRLGSRLIIAAGPVDSTLGAIVAETGANTVCCGQTFDPVADDIDRRIRAQLANQHIRIQTVNATLLSPPNLLKTKAGEPFRVFTPFARTMVDHGFTSVDNLSAPVVHLLAPERWPRSLAIDDLRLGETLAPSGLDWAAGFDFTPGEAGAHAALDAFIEHGLRHYADGRDRPDKAATSRLSPHLRFGEISPQRVLHDVERAAANDPGLRTGAAKFRAEILWREFCYGLLHQQPQLHQVNFRGGFDGFPWRDDEAAFRAWTRGETGYPLVDAGMRQLWQTGWMHNRVRMVTASFLTKHLLIDWRRGEQWFWDCLLDADPANNPAGWQWVAGSGADAAPYFRIFNPALQAQRYDPHAAYRRRFIPGYTESSPGRVHRRVEADLFDLAGEDSRNATYPLEIVDHAFARQRALDAYRQREGGKAGETDDDHDDTD